MRLIPRHLAARVERALRTSRVVNVVGPRQAGKTTLVSVLDIGSTKICCVIARLAPRPDGGRSLRGRTHVVEVIGFGYGPSAGIKSGVITDIEKAEQAVRTVVGMAERAAGLTVQSVIVNVTAGRLGSETFSAAVNLGGQEVEDLLFQGRCGS